LFASPTFVKTSSGWSASRNDSLLRALAVVEDVLTRGCLQQDNPRCCGVSSVAVLTGERRGNVYPLPSRRDCHRGWCISVAWPVRCHGGCGLGLPRERLRDRHRGWCVSVAWPVQCHGGCSLRLPRGRLRDRHRGCGVSLASPVRCHRGCGLLLPRGLPRYHRRGCDISLTWPVRCRRRCGFRLRRRRSSGPSTPLRRFLHFAYRAVAKNCPPATLSIISPIVSPIVSPIISSIVSPIISSIISSNTASITSGSSSRVYLRCFPEHQCDILSVIRAASSRVSGISEPDVEDGRQDKEEPPRFRRIGYCKPIFGGYRFGRFARRVPDIRVRPRLPEVPSCPTVTTIRAARRPGPGRAQSKKIGPACGREWADARGLRAPLPASLGWCSAAMAGTPLPWARWAASRPVVTVLATLSTRASSPGNVGKWDGVGTLPDLRQSASSGASFHPAQMRVGDGFCS
jgi:hypothetical protein